MAEKDMADNRQIVTLSEAKARGLLLYFTGVPCRRGHVMDRRVAGAACIGCRRELVNEWRAKNPDRVKAFYANARLKAGPKRREASRLWREANPDAVRENLKMWRLENREAVLAYAREWKQNNRVAATAQQNLRRARQMGAGGSYTAADVAALNSRQKGRCAECADRPKAKLQVDHIQPLARGGSNAARNLQLLCARCNRQKHAKDPILWAKEKGRLL